MTFIIAQYDWFLPISKEKKMGDKHNLTSVGALIQSYGSVTEAPRILIRKKNIRVTTRVYEYFEINYEFFGHAQD